MRGSVFVDTNVFVYTQSETESLKRETSEDLQDEQIIENAIEIVNVFKRSI